MMFIQDSVYQKLLIGSFLTELFKRNQGVTTFLKHSVQSVTVNPILMSIIWNYYSILTTQNSSIQILHAYIILAMTNRDNASSQTHLSICSSNL